MLRIKRIYTAPDEHDGYRVLVDRLWPRGVAKEKAAIDIWLKDVAPSAELRTWFGHDPARFSEFKERYETELTANPALSELKSILQQHPAVTLLYSAKDEAHNQAVVLRDFLERS